jgi:hypothetical protein
LFSILNNFIKKRLLGLKNYEIPKETATKQWAKTPPKRNYNI